jgi:hypothetical protein
VKYSDINSKEELSTLIERLQHAHWHTKDFAFLLAEDITICGYFYNDISDSNKVVLFVFSKTIKPQDIKSPTTSNVFTLLKMYGSSAMYKGLLDISGKVILPNNYDDILPFAYDRLIISKNNKVGMIYTNGTIIAPPKYDQFFDAWDYTIGFVLNKKVGFMDTNCKVVIEPKFELSTVNNHFRESVIVVEELIANEPYQYCIDHYGLIQGEMQYVGPEPEYNPSYEDGSPDPYSDPLDAYDGDTDARWNTD